MTLDEIRNLPGNTITAKVAAEYLGMNVQALRWTARERPELLGFPVVSYQNEGSVTWHCTIPKQAFITFCTEGYRMIGGAADGK